MNNLLVELIVEELPPKALKKLGESFAATLAAKLKSSGLVNETTVTPYASPRRLAVHLTSVAAKAADKPVQQKLMPVAVALDANGKFLALRMREHPITPPQADRGYRKLYLQTVTQADQGVDFDFLRASTQRGTIPGKAE